LNTRLTSDPQEAAAFVRSGALVAFPTETVYGLGADAFSEPAVKAIFEAKGRPGDNPLIVHVGSPADVALVAAEISLVAERLIEAFFPGPLTLVLPKRKDLPLVTTAGLDSVGVRMPRHDVALEFLNACGCAVAAPSANRSGRPSPTSWQAVQEDLEGRIACILKSAPSEVGLESTVVDVRGETPLILRAGSVTPAQLRRVAPGVRMADAGDALARSPGTRHRHYAPEALVIPVYAPNDALPGRNAAYIGVHPPAYDSFGMTRICATVEEYAENLYAFFRAAETMGLARIYCEAVPAEGLGLALMDRITRAADGSQDHSGT
jgi:L-threonylcarbamoyladenylate synthase